LGRHQINYLLPKDVKERAEKKCKGKYRDSIEVVDPGTVLRVEPLWIEVPDEKPNT